LRAELHQRALALLRHGGQTCCTAELPRILPAWKTATVVSFAERIAEASDFGLLPILGDALEEAGCDAPEVLRHTRAGGEHAGPCWVVELVLAR
jgi:hypothetical protein